MPPINQYHDAQWQQFEQTDPPFCTKKLHTTDNESDRNTSIFLEAAAAAKSLQSCGTVCDPIDGSPPGSPIPGILQARTLEWVAISFSKA